MTPSEIRAKGYAALLRELGPEGYVRFLQQFTPGRGDYTKERQQWADKLTMDDIRRLLAERRSRVASGVKRKRA
jgi:hypothetical protein